MALPGSPNALCEWGQRNFGLRGSLGRDEDDTQATLAHAKAWGVVKFPVTLLGAPTLFGAPRSAHITGQEATTTEMTACEMASGGEQERRSGVNGCATPSGAPRQESCGDAPHSALEHAHCTTGVTLIPRSMAQRSLARCRGRQAGAAREGNSCGCWRETLLGAPRWVHGLWCALHVGVT